MCNAMPFLCVCEGKGFGKWPGDEVGGVGCGAWCGGALVQYN